MWYNDLDVVPFLEAADWKWAPSGRRERSTCLKMVSLVEGQTYFSLFDQANKDLYNLIKDNKTGGPGIIFHRYHEAGETKLREVEKGQDARLCKEIVGYDTNALYLWALMQNMPTGSFTRRLSEDEFKP